jgi:D-amino-acid dehydrogenase
LKKLDIAVVGAGIVGLAAAYYLTKQGAQVTLFDRDPEGDKASLGNTEVTPASTPGTFWRVFGWMLDPLGPLAVRPTHALNLIPWLTRFARAGSPTEVDRISRALAAINARVYTDLLPMLADIGLSGELHRNGALSVYESEQGYRRDAADRARQRDLGIIVQEISGDEARQMEPALGPVVHRAVRFPDWSYVSDPKRVVDSARNWLLKSGAEVRRGEVHNVIPALPGTPGSVRVETGYGTHAADRVVIAAGAWSAVLARRIGDRAVLESERGYNMTIPNSGIALNQQLIFAERKFVATPLSCGLRIGGAAEFGGLHCSPNFRRSLALVDLARRYLPRLRTNGGISWAGHRPATPDSLPVISRSLYNANVFYAFGHGHLGLTQAATTGRLISELVFSKAPSLAIAPYSVARFTRALRHSMLV